jgi:hypothetical protein
MAPPPHNLDTGGRLTGHDMSQYMSEFAEKLLHDKIMFNTEILKVERNYHGDSPWSIGVCNRETGATETLVFDKIVLCTGVSGPWCSPKLVWTDSFPYV